MYLHKNLLDKLTFLSSNSKFHSSNRFKTLTLPLPIVLNTYQFFPISITFSSTSYLQPLTSYRHSYHCNTRILVPSGTTTTTTTTPPVLLNMSHLSLPLSTSLFPYLKQYLSNLPSYFSLYRVCISNDNGLIEQLE